MAFADRLNDNRLPSVEEACEILGVRPDDDEATVRRAYRRQARSMHPDAGGNAEEFRLLQQAVERLLAPPSLADATNPKPAASRSTTNVRRPSTQAPVHAAGVGESSSVRWHPDLPSIDVDLERPAAPPATTWTRDDLVRVLVADGALAAGAHGYSRGPDASLNRIGRWISRDLMSSFRIGPADQRGVKGHDLSLRLDIPPGRGRRRVDDSTTPNGWTKFRRPNSTVVELLMAPSRQTASTAVRAADHLSELLTHLAWPLEQWWHLEVRR